jgi:selenide,water dikinase
LRQLPPIRDPKLLVGADVADDAGIYRLDAGRALVQTVDFFTPIVDDPFAYGQIAAAKSLSDVYAMGGRPLTALNIVGVPTDAMPPKVIGTILRGGAIKAREARCTLVGGHTMRNPEPIYGLAVTGLVSPRRMMTNAAGRAGDCLVLTKPLGSGIITTGIKLGLTPAPLARRATAIMVQLNSVGPKLAERGLVEAAVDVTGFGLLGHLGLICRHSGLSAQIEVSKLPMIGQGVYDLIGKDCVPGGTRQNLEAANAFVDWGHASQAQKLLVTDAQTSGGLLLCVRPQKLAAVLRLLKRHRTACAVVIGQLERSAQPCVRLLTRGA